MDTKPHLIQSYTSLPKTAAKVAAAFLVLTTLPVTGANDVRRTTQAKVFSEPETFIQQRKGSLLTVLVPQLAPYNAATDARRLAQAKIFSEPELFAQAARSFGVVTLNAIAPPSPIQIAIRAIFVENAVSFRGQKSSFVVLNGIPAVVQSSDVIMGMDTYGWPPVPEDYFAPSQRPSSVVLNSFPQYSPGTDVRRAAQAKYFTDPEVFSSPRVGRPSITNLFGYVPASDVTRFAKQQKVFSEPEFFAQSRAPLTHQINFTPYVPGTDVRRAQQFKAYTDPEVFTRPLPFNELITNGTAAPPPSAVLEFANGIDIYDYRNGSILVAWGKFNPTPDSYNVYVDGVLYANVTSLQTVISGLTIATYNNAGGVAPTGNSLRPQNMPPVGDVVPSTTYNIKIVAVSVGAERGAIERLVTPEPSSDMLTTPMKRLFPFPNTGLD